jgi:hypothetical protein
MAREIQRLHIRRLLGLGTNGEAASQPIRQLDGTSFGAFLSDVRNLHSPGGEATNIDVGYVEQSAAPVGGGKWTFLGVLKLAATRSFFGIANGKFWQQGNFTGTWAEHASFALDTSERWSGDQYRRIYFMTNGTDDPLTWDGTDAFIWIIPSPVSAPTTGVQAGSLTTAGTGFSYKYRYYRTSDGHRSPSSPASGRQTATAQDVQVNYVAKTTDGVDKVEIFRTTDGGATYRFLAEADSSLTQYIDSTPDTSLSLTVDNMDAALEDINFKTAEVVGDRIYVTGLTEDSVEYPTRTRWTHPGQPWRFDALNFSDEADDVVKAVRRALSGLVVFTPRNAIRVRHIGGSAHTFEEIGLPGAIDQYATARTPDGAAWFTPQAVYMLSRDGFENISDPGPARSSGGVTEPQRGSIEALWETIDDFDDAWIIHHGQNDYLVIGGIQIDSVDLMLLYDLTRNMWWRLDYGGAFPVAVPELSGPDNMTEIYVGLTDGSVIHMLTGQDADGAALNPFWKIGPTDGLLENVKRFRHFELHFDAIQDVQFQFKYFVNGDEQIGLETIGTTIPGDQLDSTFIMDQSFLSGQAREERAIPFCATGSWISWEVTEQFGTSKVVIPSQDLKFQVVP